VRRVPASLEDVFINRVKEPAQASS